MNSTIELSYCHADRQEVRWRTKEVKMGAKRNIKKELFSELDLSGSEKEMLDMTKLSDDDLYRTIGTAAKNTLDTLKPGTEYLKSRNIGDTTGKSAFFFTNPKIEAKAPALYSDLPDDPLEAGKVVCGQLEGYLDKVICETVTHSSLYGFKQEALRLAMQCVEAIAKEYPTVDSKIDKAYVAFHAKEQFNKCTRW
jgi:hypothetical protein